MRELLLLMVRIRHLLLKNVSEIELHNLFHLLIVKIDILPKMVWVVVEDVKHIVSLPSFLFII